jgi:Leucine-rich repeat (LRR) protein
MTNQHNHYAICNKINPNTCFGLDSKGVSHTFEMNNKYKVDCSFKDLICLVIGRNVKTVFCNDNNLTTLVLPDNLEELFCYNNNLTTLVLNDRLLNIECYGNKLSTIKINDKLRWLSCYDNNISSIELNSRLESFYCYDNPIDSVINAYYKLTLVICSFKHMDFIKQNRHFSTFKIVIIPSKADRIAELKRLTA